MRRREEQKRRWLEELDKQREETSERRRRDKELQNQVPSGPVYTRVGSNAAVAEGVSCAFSRRTTSCGPPTLTPCRGSLLSQPQPQHLPLLPHWKAWSSVSGSPHPGCLSSQRP